MKEIFTDNVFISTRVTSPGITQTRRVERQRKSGAIEVHAYFIGKRGGYQSGGVCVFTPDEWALINRQLARLDQLAKEGALADNAVIKDGKLTGYGFDAAFPK